MSISFDFSVFSSSFFDVSILIYAAAVGIMTGACASVLGVNLVLKRYSMIGDGLSHVGFLALSIVALLCFTGNIELYITVPIVTLAAFLLMWLSESGKLKGDAATALVSVGTMAAGYIIFSIAGSGSGDVCAGLFGASILTLSNTDLIICIALTVIVLSVYILFYNHIFTITFDESFAKACGVNTKAFNMLLSVLIAVTVVVGMKLVGAIMISAIIVVPTVTAMRLFKNFFAGVISSAAISVLTFIIGFVFSVTFVITENSTGKITMLPVGATIVCFNILVLIAVCTVKAARLKIINKKSA